MPIIVSRRATNVDEANVSFWRIAIGEMKYLLLEEGVVYCCYIREREGGKQIRIGTDAGT